MTRDELRAWLDRPPPPFGFAQLGNGRTWRDWFAGEYLGERSARTGPDDVGAAQRCGCVQCRPVAEST